MSLCQGNGDMLVAAIKFDGVGVVGTPNMVMKYSDQSQDLTALALSGDMLAICVDGKIYIHDLSKEITRLLTTGSTM